MPYTDTHVTNALDLEPLPTDDERCACCGQRARLWSDRLMRALCGLGCARVTLASLSCFAD